MLYDDDTNLLIPKSIVILAKQFAGGVFELKRFHGAGSEEVLDEFSDSIYKVILIIYFSETIYLVIRGIVEIVDVFWHDHASWVCVPFHVIGM